MFIRNMGFGVLAMFLGLAGCVSAASTSNQSRSAFGAEIFPVPQEVKWGSGQLKCENWRLDAAENADADAVSLLKSLLGQPGRKGISVYIGQDSAGKYGIAKKSGAYYLSVSPAKITAVGYDARGTFYAVQTLRQLIDVKSKVIAQVQIRDWPDIEFRGTVEGFYGTPWSHKKRLMQLDFYGRWKMNTYIYGPKDDPYHSSPNWRKPYPTDEARHISELVERAKANKVDFVWAIHPGKDIKWTDEDENNVIGKFQMMYDLGVRSFAVFFDDIGGKGTDPRRQAALLNKINERFIKVKGDCTPLIMCPTQYNRAWSGGDYLDILGTELDKSVHIMWTGDTVVHDITNAGQKWINSRIKRPAYVWLNWPVSDFVRNHLLMGRFYGTDSPDDPAAFCSGFVSNPMERSEASKVALFSIADYCWNVKAFDSQKAWQAAIREAVPEAPAAFAVFCTHNSSHGPNGHGYDREESVAIADSVAAFKKKYMADGTLGAEYQAVLAEFDRIRKAPADITGKCRNTELLDEISPWLEQFALLGDAGYSALKLAGCVQEKDYSGGWNYYLDAKAAFDQMAANNKMKNQNGWQNGVLVGSKVMAPLAKDVFETAGARYYGSLSGRPVTVISPISSFGDGGNDARMIDDDPKSFAYFRRIQKVGDFVGVDMGVVVPVRKVSIVQGRSDGDHDIIHKGQLECSVDMKIWQPLGGEMTGFKVDYSGKPINARYVRYRVVRAGKLDGTKDDVWTAIRSFKVNPVKTSADFITNVASLAKTPVQTGDRKISVSPKFETIKLKSGDYYGIALPDNCTIASVMVDLKVAQPQRKGRIEFSADGRNWNPVRSRTQGTMLTNLIRNGRVRFVRFVNHTADEQEVYMQAFELGVIFDKSAIGAADAIIDDNLSTSVKTKVSSPFIVNNSQRAEKTVTVLLGSAGIDSADVYAVSNGKKKKLGRIENRFGSFDLPGNVDRIEIAVDNPPADIEIVEVIFK